MQKFSDNIGRMVSRQRIWIKAEVDGNKKQFMEMIGWSLAHLIDL